MRDLAVLAVSLTSAYSSAGGLYPLGALFAANAFAYAWVGAGLAVGAAYLLSRYSLQGAWVAPRHQLWLALVWWVACVGPDVALGSFTALWAAPLHVGAAAAVLCILVGCAASFPGSQPRLLGEPLSAALLPLVAVLGATWNYLQTWEDAAWAWDWIELAPVLGMGGAVLGAHVWARGRGVFVFLGYAACLQISRNALTLSLHHAQPPLTPIPSPRVPLQASSAGLLGGAVALWAAFGFFVSRGAAPLLPPRPLTGESGGGLGFFALHAVLVAGATLVTAACWLPPEQALTASITAVGGALLRTRRLS